MPYIEPERRSFYDPHIEALANALLHDVKPDGAFCYIVFRLLRAWFHTRHSWGEANRMMGAAERACDEFYRTDVGPYEDKAIEKNGPILP